MDLENVAGVVSTAVANKLRHHQCTEQQHVDALLATQKHAMSNLRTLINGLDLILQLSTPKYSSSHADLLRSMVSRCRGLQKTLETVTARVQRLQAQLQRADHTQQPEQQPIGRAEPAPLQQQQPTRSAEQQQQQQEPADSTEQQQQQQQQPADSTEQQAPADCAEQQ